MKARTAFTMLNFAKRLKEAGVEAKIAEAQAQVTLEVIVGLLDENLATKQDFQLARQELMLVKSELLNPIAETDHKLNEIRVSLEHLIMQVRTDLEHQIAEVKAELKQDIANVRTEFKQDIANLRAELKQDIADLRTELKQEIADLRTELKQEIADLRTELKQEIADLRVELKQDIADLRTEFQHSISDARQEISRLENRLTIRLGVIAASSVTLIGTIVGLLCHFVH